MTKPKGGLGKGISALIRPLNQVELKTQETVSAVKQDNRVITHIEISKIRPNPFQPRADFDQQALDELKESIRQKGIIQPITVRKVDDEFYELISGERRIRASIEIGKKTIPAYIYDVKNPQEMLELALIENLQREHLNPIEIAISYQRLVKEVGFSVEEVAQKLSKDRSTIVNFIRLLKLPEKIQIALRKNLLTTGHARALLSLPDEPTQLRVFERIINKHLSVRQVERLVKNIGKIKKKKVIPITTANQTAILSIQDHLQKILGTKVRIRILEDGKGEIVVEFYSSDDLGRLVDLIASIEQ